MVSAEQKFFSYIESQIHEKGTLYARFNLGTFNSGQALTVANALRRTLLAEIPGLSITSVEIEGVNHEFASLPGIKENILNILLNLKRMALIAKKEHLEKIATQRQELVASLNVSGPAKITAGDIRFPSGIMPVYSDHLIATLGLSGKLKFNLTIQFLDPLQASHINFPGHQKVDKNGSKKLIINTVPNPVQQVNYGIRQLEGRENQEYICLEIWTDGSIDPKFALDYALEKLTQMFYDFTVLNKKFLNTGCT